MHSKFSVKDRVEFLSFLFLVFGFVFFNHIGFASASDGNFAGGNGSSGSPYQIEDCLDLQAMSNYTASYFILNNDIDCSDTVNWNGGSGFAPIGNYGDIFTGTLDGQGYKVDSLTIYRPSTAYVGLVSVMGSTSTVSNIGLTNVNITASSYSGALVGAFDNGSIDNSYSTGSLTGESVGSVAYVGGLIGRSSNTASTIDSYSLVEVSADNFIGGLMGYLLGGTVENSYAGGLLTVPQGNTKGGLIGRKTSGTVTNSFFDADTTGTLDSSQGGTGKTTAQMMTQSTFTGFDFSLDTGGVIGDWIMAGYPHLQMEHRTSITTAVELQLMKVDMTENYTLANDIDCDCSGWNNGAGFAPMISGSHYFEGDFDGQGHIISNLYIDRSSSSLTSLLGYTYNNSVSNVYLKNVDITGSGATGALIGESHGSTVTNVYAEGTVTGGYSSGVLMGGNYGILNRAYSSGTITSASTAIGGLVGINSGTINDSYSLADVTAALKGGGLVGTLTGGSVNRSYAVGSVDAGGTAGGLVGNIEEGGGTVNDSFYDNQTSGQSDTGKGVGKTTSEMKDVATFTDTGTSGLNSAWDFVNNPNDDSGNNNYWSISSVLNSGYPYLSNFSVYAAGITDFAISVSDSDASLSWTNPSDNYFDHLIIRRGTSSYPTSISDGTSVVSNSTSTSYDDTSLADGTYYYSVFTVNFFDEASSAVTSSAVIDTVAPVITLLGESSVEVNQGATYTDAGATAVDAIDGSLTNSISTSGSVDVNTPGTYIITYSVSDAHGNAASTISRTVTVVAAGGSFVYIAPATGSGGSNSSAGMGETIEIGEIDSEGVNFLAYINSKGNFIIGGESHSIFISDLDLQDEGNVKFTLQSTPQNFDLKLGESVNVDLDEDGIDDMFIKFASLWVNRVELTLKSFEKNTKQIAKSKVETKVVAPVAVNNKSCPSTSFTRNLQLGMKGNDVLELQKYLNNNGFVLAQNSYGSPGQETTYFGSLTKTALSKFQQNKNVKANLGNFDTATREYLGCVTYVNFNTSKFNRNLEVGMHGDDVKELQKYLNNNGFVLAQDSYGSPGQETIYFGSLTKSALLRFQTANNLLKESGYVGELTRIILNK